MTLDPKTYWAYVKSTNDSGNASAAPVRFSVTSGADGLDYSPAMVLFEYLTDAAIFTNPVYETTWPLYISNLPDGKGAVDDCAAIYDTSGLVNGRISSGENIIKYGIQIRVRAKEYTDGWDKGQELVKFFESGAFEVEMPDGVAYEVLNMHQTTPYAATGVEEGSKRRMLFSVNFLVTIKEK
jgi:hypothetical protein